MDLRPTLTNGFPRVLPIVKKAKVPRRLACGVLTIQMCLIIFAARVHSPCVDEAAHLAAGMSHWRLGGFQLYAVNPPIVRLAASLPVLSSVGD